MKNFNTVVFLACTLSLGCAKMKTTGTTNSGVSPSQDRPVAQSEEEDTLDNFTESVERAKNCVLKLESSRTLKANRIFIEIFCRGERTRRRTVPLTSRSTIASNLGKLNSLFHKNKFIQTSCFAKDDSTVICNYFRPLE